LITLRSALPPKQIQRAEAEQFNCCRIGDSRKIFIAGGHSHNS
jgi:hypothetical protein